MGIRNSIVFLGNRNDVNRLYQVMDVFILPSRYEGLPVVGVEAQAAGLPCVFSDAITEDICLSKMVAVQSLNKPAREWAENAMRARGADRCDTEELIRRSGFDICVEGKKLEIFYLELLKHRRDKKTKCMM